MKEKQRLGSFSGLTLSPLPVFLSPLLGPRSESTADRKERNSKLEQERVDPVLVSVELARSKVFFDPVKYHWTLMYPTIMRTVHRSTDLGIVV